MSVETGEGCLGEDRVGAGLLGLREAGLGSPGFPVLSVESYDSCLAIPSHPSTPTQERMP